MKYGIARFINGVTINGYEYVLDSDGKVLDFDSQEAAEAWLTENEIEWGEGTGIYIEQLDNS